MNKKLLIMFTLFAVLVISASGFLYFKKTQATKGMVFEVTVPKNTPEGDTVHVFFQGWKEHFKLSRKSENVFYISFTQDQLNLENGSEIKYRYSRNGDNYNTAEYLEPDTNDYFWTEGGRTAKVAYGKTIKDTVKRWRWFPEEGAPIQRTTNLTPKGNFSPRINGQEFFSGQIIEDLYRESYDDFFDSTALHMKKTGYNSVEIDPPWQWVEENGLPKVKNEFDKNPNYPSDKKLTEEIKAYKSQGLKVMMQPQICCNPLETKNRSKEWWDVYFKETTDFLVHFAKIAEENGVDNFHYAIDRQYEGDDAGKRWTQVFSEVRKVYKGKVGQMLWNGGSNVGAIHPDLDYITWGNELDYFYIAVDAPISTKDNATDEELLAGAGKMLDGTKKLYEKFGKLVYVRTTYFNVKSTWKGNSFYSISDVPWPSDPEDAIRKTKYEWNTEDLSRTVNAYFQAIASRPWIVSYAQFGYTHWENPLSSELSVRGKPAEDIWRKWNEVIFKK